jgi:hypothetical protein
MLPFVPANRVFPDAPSLAFLREKAVEGERVGATNLAMGSNFEMMYGLKAPGGYDFRLRRTARVLTAVGSPGGHLTLDATKIAASRPYGLFDLLGTRYLLASARNPASAALEKSPERFSLVFQERSNRIYRNLTALPRAFVVPWRGVRRLDTEKREFFTVASRSFDARSELVLASGAPVPDAIPPGPPGEWFPATNFSETPGEVSFAVDSSSGGVAVVTSSHYPGWKAWVDDRPTPILRADFAFQGIPVPPGRHAVRLRYQPATFRVCLLVSIAGWLVWAGLFFSRRREPAPPETT